MGFGDTIKDTAVALAVLATLIAVATAIFNFKKIVDYLKGSLIPKFLNKEKQVQETYDLVSARENSYKSSLHDDKLNVIERTSDGNNTTYQFGKEELHKASRFQRALLKYGTPVETVENLSGEDIHDTVSTIGGYIPPIWIGAKIGEGVKKLFAR